MSTENNNPATQEEALGNEWLTPDIKEQVKNTVAKLKKDKGLKRIFPIAIQGDECDDKPFYVAYFKQPDFLAFSKYLTISQKQDPSVSMRQLARDCFVGGDNELVDDDSLFIYGTMPYLSPLIQTRRGALVTF